MFWLVVNTNLNIMKNTKELLDQAKAFMKKGDVSAYLKALMNIQELRKATIPVKS